MTHYPNYNAEETFNAVLLSNDCSNAVQGANGSADKLCGVIIASLV